MKPELIEELKNISVLCVEDEDGIRQTIVNTLNYYFKDVYEATSGNEGFELYEYYKPKIVITDIQMRDGNGVELVKRIRENDFETMIIMLTAHSNEEYLMDLINLNINHYILKPLNLKKLSQALEKYLVKSSKPVMLSDDLLFDLQKRELIYKGSEIIPLRKREKDFLYLLYEKKGSILKYEEIEFELWNDKEMTTHALKSFIKELRNKLPVNVIKNVPQEGYTLQK
ncbi:MULTISPECIES: response regulator transcription factor [Arcobacter]|jgi:DNA-binding response OmpR family regulator|uniref:DNA-binding response regulator n=1 Tax=Arcobacter ellisii TaxID=913109 RepID=A0A347U9T2_9BACT|nr:MULTISPECIES: response regulator transcription factor [Arcobacter]AXX95610.1 two-component system response regulator [Arcobacter ellisii]MDY3205707.1 response regulator transcription factor [Arcobacter sp.]RXI31513.1 DNA-binding response regulator [Arcobacter ellisii]